MGLTQRLLSALLAGSVVLAAGCQGQPLATPLATTPIARSASLEGVTLGYRQVAQQIFDDLDADKDDRLEPAELDAFKQKGGETAQILTADRNFDKAVTRDEFMDPAYVKLIVDQIRFQMANLFTKTDRNGDGFVQPAELVTGKNAVTDDLFRQYDRNNNRKLNLSEFEDLIWVDLMPRSVNPLNQLQPDQFPQLPEAFSFTVTLTNPAKIATVMIKKVDATTPIVFLTAPQDPIPTRIIRELTAGKYSVTIKQTDGFAASRQIDADHGLNVTVTPTRGGPQIAVENATAKASE